MTLIKPFRALRPAPGRAAEVLAPPYDVLSSAEARERAKGKPWSFLHISKPEIDLDPATDPYDKAVYAKAAENLNRMVEDGVLMRDSKPCYYVYRLTWRDRIQTGLAAVASLADYATNRIRKHELTTPAKEDDRVRQIEAINAQTGPVMSGYPTAPAIDAMLAQAAAGTAGSRCHRRRRRAPPALGDRRRRRPSASSRAHSSALPAIYIADGHHRSAAAARVCAARKGDGSHSYFLSVIFPEHEMTILDYNRVVRDLNGQQRRAISRRAAQEIHGDGAPTSRCGRLHPNEYGMYLAGRWYRLSIRPELVPGDPIGRLPITLLTRNVDRAAASASQDPRTDKRIDFVGGARGLEELEKRVESGEMAVAFALYPTQMRDLMAVADAGGIMPPKSTWFEPKLADGMVNHVLD